MKFFSIVSGSKGNSYIISTKNNNILVDAGISSKKIMDGIFKAGLSMEEIDTILITHEHIDHSRGLRPLLKHCSSDIKVYMSLGTFRNIDGIDKYKDDGIISIISQDDEINIGNISIKPFELHHDAAEPLGFSIDDGTYKTSIVTDTGVICENIYTFLYDADIIVLEANHDEDMLRFGTYPYKTKRRILSKFGHLSNEHTANQIAKIINDSNAPKKKRKICLAHISEQNNMEDIAVLTIGNVLERDTDKWIDKIDLSILKQNEHVGWITI